MTISKRERQQVRHNPYVGLTGTIRKSKSAPKPASKPAQDAASPTPTKADVGIAGGSMTPAPDKTESLGVSGAPKESDTQELKQDLGVSGVNKPKPEESKQDLGVSGIEEEKQVGVGTTFQTIARTPPLLMKMRREPSRMYKTPSWSGIVGFVSKDGQFYNTQTTYAEWYALLAIAAMYDDLAVYWGPIVRGALPNIWPQGPAQAIAEAKAAGVQAGSHGILNPGKDVLVWMINGKVRQWIKGYLNANYPNGIDVD